MTDKKYVHILCEDKQQSAFISRFFKKKGWDIGNVNFLKSSGGSGEHYVREKYPDELKVARKKKILLVVMIDADVTGADERLRQLDDACRTQKVDVCTSNDKVAVFVPARNIETWLAFLDKKDDVCESKVYPKLQKEKECKTHVDKLLYMCQKQQKLPENAPSSLRNAYKEWKRVA